MDDYQKIRGTLLDILGEEGCGITCEDGVDILHDEEGWKLMLCGFTEPGSLGRQLRKPGLPSGNSAPCASAYPEDFFFGAARQLRPCG